MIELFSILILVFSVIIHEISHGYAADALGDPTAKYAGRLTLNPIKHIDPIGSIFVPIILASINSRFILGWAKPVPVNPYNFKNQRWGELLVSIAGPASNLALAIIFGLLIRLVISFHIFLPFSFYEILIISVVINISLFLFNMMPIPPLDGSKILFSFLPIKYYYVRDWLERYGSILLIFFVVFLWKFISPLVSDIFILITGLSF